MESSLNITEIYRSIICVEEWNEMVHIDVPGACVNIDMSTYQNRNSHD